MLLPLSSALLPLAQPSPEKVAFVVNTPPCPPGGVAFNAEKKIFLRRLARLILSQQSAIPSNTTSRSRSAVAAWRLGVDHPGDVVCAGPKYQYQYDEGLHLIAHEYDRLGAKYGQVFYETVVLGHAWQPLQPKSAVKAGAVITVDFDVPVMPLNWDENIPPPHQNAFVEWKSGRGFEVEDSTGRLTISSVAIEGASVKITLQSAVTSNGLVVRYAMTQDQDGLIAGPTTGRRGQLRDSDALVDAYAETLTCKVSNGSTTIQPLTPGAFSGRGSRDRAAGANLAAETIVISKASDDALTLSQPWTGATGNAELQFQSDQRNYCVHFELQVP